MPTKIVDDPWFPRRSKYGCTHPEHEPPTMIVIPAGKMLVHECPACGKVTTLRMPISIRLAMPEGVWVTRVRRGGRDIRFEAKVQGGTIAVRSVQSREETR